MAAGSRWMRHAATGSRGGIRDGLRLRAATVSPPGGDLFIGYRSGVSVLHLNAYTDKKVMFLHMFGEPGLVFHA